MTPELTVAWQEYEEAVHAVMVQKDVVEATGEGVTELRRLFYTAEATRSQYLWAYERDRTHRERDFSEERKKVGIDAYLCIRSGMIANWAAVILVVVIGIWLYLHK